MLIETSICVSLVFLVIVAVRAAMSISTKSDKPNWDKLEGFGQQEQITV